MKILDIHTHHTPPQPYGIINMLPECSEMPTPADGQLYSVGIHPWSSDKPYDMTLLQTLARRAEVVAIGESGVDLSSDIPLFKQLNVMHEMIELSESAKKPLIIHDVKAHDIIIGLKRDLHPAMPWIIHVFRGKPQVAEMLLRAGMILSFGEHFNQETLKIVPDDRILAETDESSLSIENIIAAMTASSGKDMEKIVATNSSTIFNIK
jgi:TatD DNase family protein